jgi:glycosyltransferase involved in cell wall biosynthesis
MRIGMLTTGYPHEGDPVGGAFVREMARALVQRGHRVRVLCAAHPRALPLRDPGIEVRPVRYAPHRALATTFYGAGAPDNLLRGDPGAWLGVLSFPPALLAYAHTALRECDALVSHFVLPCGLIAGLVRHGRPHLAIAHGTDALLLARMPAWLQRSVLAGSTTLQLTHAGLRARLDPTVAHDPRVTVCPMGFTPAPAPPASERDAVRASLGVRDEVLVLAVARMVPVKGLDTLVAAAARLGPDVVVVLAGDGPERARLEAAVDPHGARVLFTGAVDAARRDALLRAADVFALPSRPLPDGRTEGAPVALLEAMGAGLAVAASHAGGIAELAGEAAVLVPPDDVEALSSALERLAHGPIARRDLGARARARVSAWTWEEQAARIEKLLTRR